MIYVDFVNGYYKRYVTTDCSSMTMDKLQLMFRMWLSMLLKQVGVIMMRVRC